MIRITFFGNEQLAQGLERVITPAFDALIAGGYEITALVLPRRAKVVSRQAQELKIVEAARAHDIEIIYADEFDLPTVLRELNAEIGVLAAYGKIVSQEIINIFPHGIVNIHPSLLPTYRGSTPIETAIVDDATETGVSLMALSANMDAGPIYAQEKIALAGSESKQELYEALANLGAKMLVDNLPSIISGQIIGQDQDENRSTYTKILTKIDGDLDPNTMTAQQCERKIRAYLGFPKTRIELLGKEVIITKAKALPDFAGDDWPDIIKCADNTALQIIEIISPTSGKQMKIADYFRGLHK